MFWGNSDVTMPLVCLADSITFYWRFPTTARTSRRQIIVVLNFDEYLQAASESDPLVIPIGDAQMKATYECTVPQNIPFVWSTYKSHCTVWYSRVQSAQTSFRCAGSKTNQW